MTKAIVSYPDNERAAVIARRLKGKSGGLGYVSAVAAERAENLKAAERIENWKADMKGINTRYGFGIALSNIENNL
jgi:hypothetical protein